MNKISQKPCPICQQLSITIGCDKKGKKILSCGHTVSFKRTRSEKEMDRKYISTPYGLELIK
jgi:hypothetical protein